MALTRIVASVTTVRPVASVQVQAANTVSTTGAGAGAVVTRVVPLAAVRWINITLEAQLDYRGLNPVVRDITLTLDHAALHFFKSAFETESVTDEQTVVFLRKVPQEDLSATELKTFDLQRQIADEVDATDDLYGVANADDEQVMFLSKALQPDSFTVGDNLEEIHFGKRPTDVVPTSDQIDKFDLGKSLEDQPQTVDVRTVSIQKPLADAVDAGDEMSALAMTDDGQVMFMVKDVPLEHQTASDQIDSVHVGKSATDAAATSESQSFAVGKSLADAPATSDERTVDVAKTLQSDSATSDQADKGTEKTLDDSFAQADEAVIEAGKALESAASVGDELLPFELGKGITDNPLTSEAQTFDVSRVSTDTATATEQIANSLSRSLVDRTYYPSEGPAQYDTYAIAYFLEDYVREGFPAFEFAKALSESKLTSETFERVVGKTLAETLGAADAPAKGLAKAFAEAVGKSDSSIVLMDKARNESLSTSETRVVAISKTLEELLDATDDFLGVANTDDDQTMVYGKRESDFLTTSEATTRAMGKSLADAYLTADLKTFDLSRSISDSVGKADATVKLTGKALSDAFGQTDSSIWLVGKAATDLASTGDALTAAVGKALSDTISKSDAAAKLAEKVLTDTFTKSDSTTLTAGKGLSDTALTGEAKTFALSKALTDIVDATDDFFGAANTDDDQTVLTAKVTSDIVSQSDTTVKTAGKGLTDPVGKSDSGSLVWTDYWDIGYTVTSSGVYVGSSRTF